MNNIPTSKENLTQSKLTLISFYKNLIAKNNTNISIENVLELIKSGKGFKNTIQRIRQEPEKAIQNQIKKLLPAVTISGLFGESRTTKYLLKHSGFIQIDFDDVIDLPKALRELQNDKFSYAVFISPGGKGIKLIVKISAEKDQHIESFTQLEKYYKKNFNLNADKQCKDISRLLFLSWDEKLFVNENSIQWQKNESDQNGLFKSVLQKLEGKETFKKGKRNDFVYKLACECCKKNIDLDSAINEIVNKFSSEDFLRKEIELTVKSAYNIKGSNIISEVENNQSYSLLRRAENYIENKYEIRLNEVSNKIECKLKDVQEPFKELNENNIFRELQHANISLPQNKLLALLLSDFVSSYNPFLHYFESLPIWDENNEPDYIEKLCGYIPAKDMKRFKLHFKKMLVRCIACALENNVFNKQVFVLVGEGQNTGKSTFCRWLCPPTLEDYITEYVNTDKDGMIVLATNFFINMDELATLSKAEINSLKSFISKDKINIRLPFAKRSSVHPRRANFIGSTNNDEFLTDETGSVRWLCFELTGTFNFDYKTEIDINNIWKEAYKLYKSGFEYQLTPSEIKENEEANNRFMVASQEVQLIRKYYKPATRQTGSFVDATDVLNYIVLRNSHIKSNIRSIGKAMKVLGFVKTTKYDNESGFSVYGYFVDEILK